MTQEIEVTQAEIDSAMWAYQETSDWGCSESGIKAALVGFVQDRLIRSDPSSDWFLGDVDADGNELISIRKDEYDRLRNALERIADPRNSYIKDDFAVIARIALKDCP